MSVAPDLPRKLMLLVAAIQGILLLFLYDAFESGTWPSDAPLWNYPLWLVSVVVPVLLLLSLESGRELRTAKLIGIFTAVLIPLAIYIGWQATPYDEFPVQNLTFVFFVSLGLACFKALMYLQQRAANQPMKYDVLFTYSWRNSLTLALSLILVFVFWLILMLWGSLFRAIKVDFFHDLFEQTWFLFPVLSIAHGVGVIIFRNLTRVIDSIARLFEGLIKILLPLAAIVSVVFLSALPFVGLDVLWATGSGTSLLLWLLAIILFFTNAVYQDGRGARPYPLAIHRVLYLALLTTPVISALSFYGLYLRLEEYGWTVMRGWAFVVWLVLALFSTGYFVGIVRKRDLWTEALAKVNTGMGLLVLVLMLVLNSPLLDLRKLSLTSQVNRLESGVVAIRDFDFWYVDHALARPGYLFMEQKKAEVGDSDPDLLALIEDPVNMRYGQRPLGIDQFWENMAYRPADLELPGGLREMIGNDYSGYPVQAKPYLVRVDLDDDQVDEYLLLLEFNQYVSGGKLYFRDDSGWRSFDVDTGSRRTTGDSTLLDGQMEVVPYRFNMLKIGNLLIRPAEKR